MKKWLSIIGLSLFVLSCVGQKDDPEDIPEDPTENPGAGGEEAGSRFFRRVLALEFTATWCQYCPNMQAALEDAQRQRPGRFVEIAVHQYDEMTPAEADALVNLFQVSYYPSMVFDWDQATLFNEQDATIMLSYLDAELEKEEEACGIAMESKIEGNVLSVVVRMKAVKAGRYSLVAALVMDNIIAENQAGYGPDYPCQAVLRSYLGGFTPASAKELAAGEEYSTTFTADAPADAGQCRIVAYILSEGKALNALSCGLNETIDYTYEKEDLD
jgi:thiol-disulfide isomerase/thioredoxin